jgi:hypothetical protein
MVKYIEGRTMKNILLPLLLSAVTMLPSYTFASQEAQQLAVCLTDSLNGKERKNLAKWIYLGMSTHSIIKPFSNVTEQDIDDTNRYVGALVTRLLTEDCPKQAKAAIDVGGQGAMENAFRLVGEVAMQELMTEPSVGNALGAFDKYLDQEKFDKAFQ